MLLELAVRDLGVIPDLRLLLSEGMSVVTGETGAGKTMVVDAIELLVGGRADPLLVRTGAEEAWVEGRFLLRAADREVVGEFGEDLEDVEVVLARAIPRNGRSRAYVDGRLATVSALVELGERLVDLHGQHAHQSLLSPVAQRAALDRFGDVDLEAVHVARQRERDIAQELAKLGGDERARAREIDLLRYQVEELEAAGVTGPDEDDELAAEEDVLADATAHHAAAAEAAAALTDEGGAGDPLGAAISALAGRAPFAAQEERLRALAAELADVAVDVRGVAEAIDEDPARLDLLRERRQLLSDLRRKYGETLVEVLAEYERLGARLAELEDHDRRAAQLDGAQAEARKAYEEEAARVAAARRAAAPELAQAVEANLRELAMPNARLEVRVEGDDPGDDVVFLLAANPGTEPQPLSKVASGGELARAMLALRLVLTSAPPTLVFDEVDAGIGGSAATAVGRALAKIGREHQVLVVTHLPQVAAHADAHVQVAKQSDGDVTVSQATVLDHDERVIELSRMLSGQPDSDTARRHAEELLATATAVGQEIVSNG
ncbi:MAG TPA: DNA repair protein RecN [Acidimicrobiales bacterium]|nr:DNA repair protein RecN [Acidimicrobiales bacterium]